MTSFKVTNEPINDLIFHGIGAEADGFIFDEMNASCGVNDDDLALIERRMRALSPAIARLFVYVDWFNPSLDGEELVWDRPEYLNLLRQLRLLDDIGTKVNLVLFSPMPPKIPDATPLVRDMIGLIDHLRNKEGLKCITWLTLYNEPDGIYLHDSPLMRRVFAARFKTQPTFEDYVRLNEEAYRLLIDRGLYPDVKLIVADTVWGHPVRIERMKLCADAFRDWDVVYSYHTYSQEDPRLRESNPDFAYPGAVEETRMLREILGPSADLMLWEFNVSGAGFGSFYPGVGPHGEDSIARVEAGAELAWKIMVAASGGVTGFSVWCLHDIVYPDMMPRAGQMTFGLWRYKWQGWYPRPYYHYFALLCRAFGPGSRILRVEGSDPGVMALAASRDGKTVVGLINTTTKPIQIAIDGLSGELRRTRVYPDMLPPGGDLPVSEESDSGREIELAGLELTVLTAES